MYRAAGGAHLLAAAAQWRSRTATGTAAAVSAGDGPPRRMSKQTVGPPLTDGHTVMRKGNPILRGIVVIARPPRIRTFFTRTPLLSATVRSDEWTIAAQTPDEKTLGIASDGPM